MKGWQLGLFYSILCIIAGIAIGWYLLGDGDFTTIEMPDSLAVAGHSTVMTFNINDYDFSEIDSFITEKGWFFFGKDTVPIPFPEVRYDTVYEDTGRTKFVYQRADPTQGWIDTLKLAILQRTNGLTFDVDTTVYRDYAKYDLSFTSVAPIERLVFADTVYHWDWYVDVGRSHARKEFRKENLVNKGLDMAAYTLAGQQFEKGNADAALQIILAREVGVPAAKWAWGVFK